MGSQGISPVSASRGTSGYDTGRPRDSSLNLARLSDIALPRRMRCQGGTSLTITIVGSKRVNDE
jgi:hypothetical protein